MTKRLKLIDIGTNLTDLMFKGIYHGKQYHPDDLSSVLKRAVDQDIRKMIITCGCAEDIKNGEKLSKTRDDLYFTVGCHPTRCNEFENKCDPDSYLNNLLDVIHSNKDKVVAVGECGLDYDRLNFCAKDVQKKYFERQIDLVEETKLPMFLHMRNANNDFCQIIKRNRDRIHGGVAHCFTGSKEELIDLLDQGLHIGVTGCSFKTEEYIDVVRKIPVEKLLIETDSPWCEIKPSHAAFQYVKTKFETKKKRSGRKEFALKAEMNRHI